VDEDLEAMTREQLVAEARRLRAGIRVHRDRTGELPDAPRSDAPYQRGRS